MFKGHFTEQRRIAIIVESSDGRPFKTDGHFSGGGTIKRQLKYDYYCMNEAG
jgi:hypothetical protein